MLQNYEAEVRAREGRKALHKDLEGVFGVLRRADSSASSSAAPAALARAPSRVSKPKLAKAPSRVSKPKLTKAPPRVPKPKLTKAPPRVSKPTKAAPASKAGKTTAAAATAAKKLVARAAAAKSSTGSKPTGKRLSSSKVKKGAVTTTTTSGTPRRKLIREKVPDTNFRFNRLRWSPWKLAALPTAGAEAEVTSGQWRRFLRGAARARVGAVLSEGGEGGAGARGRGKGQGSAVMCEAAVQTRPGARRHVVWCRVLPASSANRLSLSRLLASPGVRAQLHRVMRSGCRVWVRRAKVSRGQNEGEVKQQVKDVYDYAWCPSNGCHREVWVPTGMATHRMQIAGAMA